MLIDEQNYSDCDVCGKKKKAEYGYIAQGATGRWCVVMSVCANCIEGQQVTPINEARTQIEISGNGYADF